MTGPPQNKAVIPASTGVSFGTPRWLYDWFDARFRFTLDPCPLHDATIWDGVARSWRGERVFCNPPYGRKEIPRWLAKRFEPDVVLYLLPVRSDTAWWHEIVLREARELMYFRNRIRFEGMKRPAYFASAAILFAANGLDDFAGRVSPQASEGPLVRSVWLSELEPGAGRGYRLPSAAVPRCQATGFMDGTGRCCLYAGHAGDHHIDGNDLGDSVAPLGYP